MGESRARKDMTESSVLTGSCLCGGIRYRAEGPLSLVARCHCIFCRKQSGAEFATNGSVETEHFKLLSGESLLRSFESSPGEMRLFCGQCGSSIFKRSETKPNLIRLRLGCLDTDFDQRIEFRVFTSRKLGISEITEDIPSFDTVPTAETSDSGSN